jgi:MFS family permease
VWLVLANLLSLAAVCPFVGSLSDVIGRKYIALIGAALIVIGQVISILQDSLSCSNTLQDYLLNLTYDEHFHCRYGNFRRWSWH